MVDSKPRRAVSEAGSLRFWGLTRVLRAEKFGSIILDQPVSVAGYLLKNR